MKNEVLSKSTLYTIALVLGLGMQLVSCGGGEEKKEETPAQDTAKAEEPKEPAYEYKYTVEEVEVAPHWAVTIGDSTTVDQLHDFFMKNFPLLGKFVASKKQEPNAPMAMYYNFSTDKKFYTVAAMYVEDSTLRVKAPMKLEKLYAGNALKVVYMGNYEDMMPAYADIEQYMKEKNLTAAGAPWEQYISDPGVEKDTAKWQTDIYFPVMAK